MAIQTSILVLKKDGDQQSEIVKAFDTATPSFWSEISLSLEASRLTELLIPVSAIDMIVLECTTASTELRIYRNQGSEYWPFEDCFLALDTDVSRIDLWADQACSIHGFVGGSA